MDFIEVIFYFKEEYCEFTYRRDLQQHSTRCFTRQTLCPTIKHKSCFVLNFISTKLITEIKVTSSPALKPVLNHQYFKQSSLLFILQMLSINSSREHEVLAQILVVQFKKPFIFLCWFGNIKDQFFFSLFLTSKKSTLSLPWLMRCLLLSVARLSAHVLSSS